jgi:hypothetical protein
LEKIYERSNAFACSKTGGSVACKCSKANMSGATCAVDCSSETKKKEVSADYLTCVCPGTAEGGEFEDD